MSDRRPTSPVWRPVHSSDFQAGYNGTPGCWAALRRLTRKTTHGDDDDGRTTSVARLASFGPDVLHVYGRWPLSRRAHTPRCPLPPTWLTNGKQGATGNSFGATSLALAPCRADRTEWRAVLFENGPTAPARPRRQRNFRRWKFGMQKKGDDDSASGQRVHRAVSARRTVVLGIVGIFSTVLALLFIAGILCFRARSVFLLPAS